MKKAYINRDVLYVGATDASYTTGERYNVDITPFSDDFIKGERIPDNRYMVYRTVTDPKASGQMDSGYRVYPSVEAVSKDFKR